MNTLIRYFILCFALTASTVCFGQVEVDVDSTELGNEDGPKLPESVAKKEGGSANRGTVYYFLENPINVGIPELRFIDTTKTLFHRNDPIMKNNLFRSNRGNIGMITEE
ncbi:MAG: hypothetical protein LBU91_05865, partial [Bacteroidales bacterium]|nr:hypothetical protein [Bacteroidales bacterium]